LVRSIIPHGLTGSWATLNGYYSLVGVTIHHFKLEIFFIDKKKPENRGIWSLDGKIHWCVGMVQWLQRLHPT